MLQKFWPKYRYVARYRIIEHVAWYCVKKFSELLHRVSGSTQWRTWSKHCATTRKVAGSIPFVVCGIFRLHNPSEVLLRVNEERNILHEIRKRKANWIGHILHRNCRLKQVIEGKIKGEMEVTRRRERGRKKLLDDLKNRKGYSHLKEEALDRAMWRNRFRGGFGPVVRQNTE